MFCIHIGVSHQGRAQSLQFTALTVHSQDGAIYGMTRGDFDPGHAGKEVACILNDSSVLELLPGSGSWEGEVIFAAHDLIQGMFERPTIGSGDVLAAVPGEEITVQGVNKVQVVFHNGTGWSSDTAFDGTEFFGTWWGARAGDYNPAHPGDEIFLIFEGVFDFSNGFIFEKDGNSWQETWVYAAEVGMDSAAGEFNPDHAGPEIIVVTEMEPTYEIVAPSQPTAERWPKREIWNRPDIDEAGWVVKIGEVDPTHQGNEVVVGTRYSNRILVSKHNGAGPHRLEIAFTGSRRQEPLNVWDIALGDVLPEKESLEILGVDESGSVYLVWREGASWRGETVWTDPSGPLHAVIAADLDPKSPGEEILVAGASGRVTLLARRPGSPFLRGDCNGDGAVAGQVTDAVFLLQFIFAGGRRPPCLAACDLNGDGQVSGQVSDAVYLLQFNFLGGPAPVAPFPACGLGTRPMDGLLGCEESPERCR